MKKFLLLLVLFYPHIVRAQMFVPMAYWNAKAARPYQLECLGCYPTPTTQFNTTGKYYVTTNTTVQLFARNSTGDTCFGPLTASGCISAPTYPLLCSGATNPGSVDASADSLVADYTSAAVPVTTDVCNVTDYSLNKVASGSIQVFNPLVFTNPTGTTPAAPRNICAMQTLSMTATGGISTTQWTINPAAGAGTIAPTTGTSSVYTAPITAVSLTVTITDPISSMTALAYLNVTNTIALTPTVSMIEVVVTPTPIYYPAGNGGVSSTITANLAFSGNCGAQPYTVTPSTAVGGAGYLNTPVGTVNNNVNKYYTPAVSMTTTPVVFTDSTTLQSSSLTSYNVLPVEIKANWNFHVCVTYSHSTYAAGTYKLKCWGYNNRGQLGYGNTTNVGTALTTIGYGITFVKDTGITGSDLILKKMAVGAYHTCAILSNDTVKCWGYNFWGQLGYDDTTNSTSPRAATVNINGGSGGGTPVDVYAFGMNSCVRFSDNRVKCLGRNTYGQLGQNNTIDYGSNNTTATMANLNYISIGGSFLLANKVVGTQLQTCALTTGFVVYCWGYGNGAQSTSATVPPTIPNATTVPTDYNGELGYGTTTQNFGDGGGGSIAMSVLPAVPVSKTAAETIIDIEAGRSHVCGIIAPTSVSTSGNPICWGWNRRGQLGIDNGTAQGISGVANTPLTNRVVNLTDATAIKLGGDITCAIRATGAVKCWGYSRRGQMLNSLITRCTGSGAVSGECGSNITMAAATNASLGTGRTAQKLATGYEFSCVILDNSGIKCWGVQSCGTAYSTTNNGCLLSGHATLNTTNPNAAASILQGSYIGDSAGEAGDNLPYVNH